MAWTNFRVADDTGVGRLPSTLRRLSHVYVLLASDPTPICFTLLASSSPYPTASAAAARAEYSSGSAHRGVQARNTSSLCMSVAATSARPGAACCGRAANQEKQRIERCAAMQSGQVSGARQVGGGKQTTEVSGRAEPRCHLKGAMAI